MIEKALAKLNGSYEAIIAGRCCEGSYLQFEQRDTGNAENTLGLATVTGSPCETLILGRSDNPDDKNVDRDHLWMKLRHARTMNFLMCAMCSNKQIDKRDFDQCGLLNIHAYSLQDLKESTDGKHRLIKLRNPWGGTHRWKGLVNYRHLHRRTVALSLFRLGDWSDDSALWVQYGELREATSEEKRRKRHGVFWMPFDSFVNYFECVDICKIRPDWYEVRDSGNFYPDHRMIQAYRLTVTTLTELDVTLHRKISKNLRIQRSEVSLCVAIVNMEEQENGNARIYSIPILSQRGQHKFVSTDGSLQPGTYLLLPCLFNPINKQMDNTQFTIGQFSSHAAHVSNR